MTAASTMASADVGAVDEPALWAVFRQSRDRAARDALVELHIPYARVVAATYYGRRIHDEIEFDDYLQYARIGLLEALERYDPTQGAQFRTFAARRMHGAILDGIERSTEKQQQIAVRQRLRRERVDAIKEAAGAETGLSRAVGRDQAPSGDALFRYLADVGIGLALCRLLEGTGMVDLSAATDSSLPAERAYHPIELAQLRRRMLDLVDGLSAQQRTVVRYHYLQEHSFADVASLMGVTRGRVSQIHRQALAALRVGLAASPSCDVSC